MREVAIFMAMYPSYKLRDVLDEYAITFFTLLNEGYRERMRHYQMLVYVNAVPQMQEKDRNKFMKQLEWAVKDPSDILKPSTKGINPDALKKILGG